MTISILGYCDRDSARPGDRIEFKVSCTGAPSYRADIVRLSCCETPAGGPGFKEMDVPCPAAGEYPAEYQTNPIGSYVQVPGFDGQAFPDGMTLLAFVWPTCPSGRRQAILGAWDESARRGFYLGLDEAGALAMTVGDGNTVATVSTEVPLPARQWHLVAGSFDARTGQVRLHQAPVVDARWSTAATATVERIIACAPSATLPGFLMAAWHEREARGRTITGGHYDGKIDRPKVAARALTPDAAMALVHGPAAFDPGTALVASWDFSIGVETDHVHDVGPNGHHGVAINLPARGVTGFNWSGTAWSWSHAPHEYGAIHFHADDLYDAGWQTSFSVSVGKDWRSGIYAARLRCGAAEFHVPFYVRPAAGTRTADVLFLVPNATYMAYANNFGRVVSPVTDALIGKMTVVDDVDLIMLERRELGLSTYDAHLDGSPVHYSSRLRPITNHRPRESDIAMAYNNFAADLLIVDWLDQTRTRFDVASDEDLHHEGAKALSGYRVVVTGTHPEYYSVEMLNALRHFINRGGRLMYLGGNGFYWRVAFRDDKPGVIELRRSQTNAMRWNPGPGQYFHSFTGDHGGLWRDLGRPPQALVGVGFISQGFDSSSFYRRAAAADDPRASFIFEGVDGEILGDFGLMRGGAAGVEIDRFDPRRGSPAHALVVASSEGHTNIFEAFEETVAIGEPIADARPAIRADMVFFECPNGGAVFSTGSIAFAGSLSHNAYDNPIARLTGNVLRRFLDPEPFVMPAGAG